MRTIRLFLVSLCVMAVPQVVVAAELRWSAPDGCPDQGALEHEVDSLLGRSLRGVQTLDVDGVIREAGSGSFSLALRTVPRAAGATAALREIEAGDCQELLEAAAVAIALAVTNSAQVVTRPRPVRVQSEYDELPPRSGKHAAGVFVPRPRSAFVLGADALLDVGTLPEPAWGAGLQVAWDYAWLRLGAAAGLLPSQRASLGSASDKAEFGLAFAGPMACGQDSFGRLRVLGCVELELGRLWAAATRAVPPRQSNTAWRALETRVSLVWPANAPVTLGGSLGISAPFTRPEFVWNNARAHQVAAACLRVQLGVAVEL